MRFHRDPVVWLGVAAGVLLDGWALFAGRYLPYPDWAGHVGLISIFAHGGETGALAYMERSFVPTPYFLFYAVTALAAQVLPVEVAAKAMLLLSTAALVLGGAFCAEACGRSPRLALIAPAALFGVNLRFGFSSFAFGTPVLFYVIGSLERLLEARGRRELRLHGAAIAVELAVAYLAHGLLFLIASGLIAVRAGIFVLSERFRSEALRPALALLLAAVPVTLIAAPYARERIANPYVSEDILASGAPPWIFRTPAEHLETAGENLLGNETPESLTAMKVAPAILLVLLAVSLFSAHPSERFARGWRGPRWGLEIASVLALAMYFFGPVMLGWPSSFWGVNARAGIVAALLLFLLPRARLAGWRAAPWALVALAFAGYVAYGQAKRNATYSSWSMRFDEVRAHIPPGSRVLTVLNLENGEPLSIHPVLSTLRYYHLADGAAYVPYSTYNPEVPVRPRSDVARPRFPRDWREFSPLTHGLDYDYVVTRGAVLPDLLRREGLHDAVFEVGGWTVWKCRAPRPVLRSDG